MKVQENVVDAQATDYGISSCAILLASTNSQKHVSTGRQNIIKTINYSTVEKEKTSLSIFQPCMMLR